MALQRPKNEVFSVKELKIPNLITEILWYVEVVTIFSLKTLLFLSLHYRFLCTLDKET